MTLDKISKTESSPWFRMVQALFLCLFLAGFYFWTTRAEHSSRVLPIQVKWQDWTQFLSQCESGDSKLVYCFEAQAAVAKKLHLRGF
ncbi:MAG: hypothetical protein KDD22_02795, partial [Bdellovibrionales bacterium]|nr:hypothetical protein [Bdellovibrionales bacterium]